jgi:hypothetical protein
MPDGTYCVNGRVTAGTPPAPREAASVPGVIDPDEFDTGAGPGSMVFEHPWFYFNHGFIDPDIERYWGDHVRLPGDNRWDLYRYRPDRRPPHRPDRSRNRPRPPSSYRSRPEGSSRVRPEGQRPPRPDEIGRPTAPRSERAYRAPRPDRRRR